jgi:hypothetical protein
MRILSFEKKMGRNIACIKEKTRLLVKMGRKKSILLVTSS